MADVREEDEAETDYDDPLQEVPVAGADFVVALASVLTHLARVGERPGPAVKVTNFHSVRAPPLGIQDYLQRIAKYFQCSNECFVFSLIYIDRIVKLHPDFKICDLNIHRLLVTSVMLAVKFFDDIYYSNAYYAKVGGVRTTEVNKLEAQFLRLIDWRLHVTPQEYDHYRNHVYTAIRAQSTTMNLELMPPPDNSNGNEDGTTKNEDGTTRAMNVDSSGPPTNPSGPYPSSG